MPEVRKDAERTGIAGAPVDRARGGQPSAPAPARETSGGSVQKLDAAALGTRLEELNAGDASAGAGAGAEGEQAERLASLSAAADDAGAEPAKAPEPPSPEALLGLAEFGLGLVVSLAPVPPGVTVPPNLGRLTDGERALLTPMAVQAAPKFAELTAVADEYAHWAFLGVVVVLGVTRWRTIQNLAPAEGSSSSTSSSSSAPSSSTGPAVPPEAHPGKIFAGRMPGSPF